MLLEVYIVGQKIISCVGIYQGEKISEACSICVKYPHPWDLSRTDAALYIS